MTGGPERPRWTRAGRIGADVGQGRELALFFYDGAISHAIAFDGLLRSGDAMATRLLAGFDECSRAQLIHVATDGESYGHHHRFGEMALAAACARIEASGAATLTNHAAFLAAHPPTLEARVVDGSSWSCAHGVERWRADCGCRAGRHPGWTQRWRAPLREALDWLRDAVDPLYEARAATLAQGSLGRARRVRRGDPRQEPGLRGRLLRSPRAPPAGRGRPRRRRSGASSSSGTACSCTRRAAGSSTRSRGSRRSRCSDTPHACCSSRGRSGAMRAWRRSSSGAWRLPRRTSPELRDGAGVWRRHVVPSVTDLARVAAHYAIAGPSEGYGDPADVHAFRIERLSWARMAAGEASLAIGRVRVTAAPTTESEEADVAVLHAARRRDPLPRPDRVRTPTRSRPRGARCSASSPGPGGPRGRRRSIGASAVASYGTADVFPDERRRLLARLAERALETPEDAGDGVEAGHPGLLEELRLAEGRVPPALASVARRSGVAKRQRRAGPACGRRARAAGGRPDSRADRRDTIAGDRRSISSAEEVAPGDPGGAWPAARGAPGRARRRRPWTMPSGSWRSGRCWRRRSISGRPRTRRRASGVRGPSPIETCWRPSWRLSGSPPPGPRGPASGGKAMAAPPLERSRRSPRPGGAGDRRRPRDRARLRAGAGPGRRRRRRRGSPVHGRAGAAIAATGGARWAFPSTSPMRTRSGARSSASSRRWDGSTFS